MIHCILTQNKLKVEQSTDVLPFQFSSNINIEFVKYDTYKNYVVTPYYAWVPTKSILPRKIDAFAVPLNDSVFTLPMSAFVKDGFLAIAFSLTNGKEILQTDPVYLAVQSSVGDTDILPDDDSWQLVVIDTVNQYIELNVNAKLQALIVEVARLNEESSNMQKEVNALVAKVNKMLEDGDFVPEHKWENTILYFKYSNGNWDEGVNLKGPSGVYFGNDEPPEDGEFNVWVLPDGTPDFEINADQVKTSDDSNVQSELNHLTDSLETIEESINLLVNQGKFQTRLSSTFSVTSNGQTDKYTFPFNNTMINIGNKVQRNDDNSFTFQEDGLVRMDFNLINYSSSATLKTGLIAVSAVLNGGNQIGTFFSPAESQVGSGPFNPVTFTWIGRVKRDDIFKLTINGDGSTTINTLFHVYSTLTMEFYKEIGG